MAGKLIAARYRLAERLGQGGMGVVHRAVDERLGRPVAVKLLEPQGAAADGLVARFEREARLAGGLQHHGITTVHDFGAEAGALYLVMELVSGQDLGRRVRGSGPLPADLVIAFFRQIADALGHAHGQGVVHRDLKPANVMVTAAEMIKICDFGIARFVLDASKDGLTQTGAVIGTPSYMSPEQATGRPIDHRTDLYSLGCLAYELLTGRPPFTADNWMGIVHQHINTAPEPPGGRGVALPRHLEELVLALLAKEPADRPADAAEVIRRLDGTAPRPRPVPEPGRAPEPERPEPEPPGPAPLSDPPAVAVRRGPRPEGPHEVLWTAEAFGAYPAVAPDAGIVICAGYHMIWALDMATGAVRWTVEDERSLLWIPTVGHGSVYLAGDQGVLSARDLGTGAEMWSVRRPALWWSQLLAITPEKVIITSGNDKAKDGLRGGVWWVEALDTATGECQWRSRGMLRHSLGQPPPMQYGVVFVRGEEGEVIALDIESGAERWRHRGLDRWETTISLAADGCIFGHGDGVVALDHRTGEVSQSYLFPSENLRAAPAYGAKRTLFVGGGRVPFTSGNSDLRNSYLDGCVRALLFGRFVHGELWSYREEGGRGRPVRLEFHQGLLYVFWTSSVDNRGGDISLFALDPGSGQRVWTFPAQGVSMSADGAFHNGVLYVSALERKDTFSAVALPDRADLPDGEPDDGEPDRGGQDEGARDAGGRLLRRWGRRYRSAG